MAVLELPARRGKGSGLERRPAPGAPGIVVFSDASIELEPDALRGSSGSSRIRQLGCVSGEDRIGDDWRRRSVRPLRAAACAAWNRRCIRSSARADRSTLSGGDSASRSRRVAPDFLSVLRTVRPGLSARSANRTAVGSMTSVADPRHEFERKVRTLDPRHDDAVRACRPC